MEKKSNSGLVVCLVVIIIVLGLIVILFETGIVRFNNANKCNVEKETVVDNNNVKAITDVVGEYKAVLNDLKIDDNSAELTLTLYNNGMFTYVLNYNVKSGTIGNYVLDGNNIVLNYLFNTGSDTAIRATMGSKKLLINDNGVIVDSDIKNNSLKENNISSIELSKSNTVVEDYDLSVYYKDEEYEKKYHTPSVFEPNL